MSKRQKLKESPQEQEAPLFQVTKMCKEEPLEVKDFFRESEFGAVMKAEVKKEKSSATTTTLKTTSASTGCLPRHGAGLAPLEQKEEANLYLKSQSDFFSCKLSDEELSGGLSPSVSSITS